MLILILQLEMASYSGFVVVLAIIAIVMHAAFSAGFPAIRSGELKVWSMNVSMVFARPACCNCLIFMQYSWYRILCK